VAVYGHVPWLLAPIPIAEGVDEVDGHYGKKPPGA
jgi:hypothetical protein